MKACRAELTVLPVIILIVMITSAYCEMSDRTLDSIQHNLIGDTYKPPNGYVGDKETATRIAEAVLISVYGKNAIESQRPFEARLKDGVWYLSGTLHQPKRIIAMLGIGRYTKGGTAMIAISQSDGRILGVAHDL